MKTNKHGISGIGVTGKQGKTGISGNSIYFGTIDSFFTYIGDDVLTNSSIDYDDRDYDITYALDELRLNYKYNEGDVLYILSSSTADASIVAMVEISEDMTTCTKEYFLDHLTFLNPFLINKYCYTYPVNIADSSGASSDKRNILYNINDKYRNGLINAFYVAPEGMDVINTSVIDLDTSLYYNKMHVDTSWFSDIPIKYCEDVSIKYKLVNNGKEIVEFKYTPGYDYREKEQTLLHVRMLSINASSNTRKTSLNIDASLSSGVFLVPSNQQLFIDNLYIRNYNYGNVEAYDTLYYEDLVLDNNGNCYTLSADNFDSSTLSLLIDVSSFFTSNNVSINDYTFGYTHMYWNYNDLNYDASYGTNLYTQNYIKGKYTDTSLMSMRVIVLDEYGNYVRDWQNSSYKAVDNAEIKQILCNLKDSVSINDIKDQLLEIMDISILSPYLSMGLKGIIKTLKEYRYPEYEYIRFNNKYQYMICTNADIDSKIYDISKGEISSKTALPTGDNKEKIDEFITTHYIDTSFYSGCDTVINPSTLYIDLTKTDGNAQSYRHHNIIQWILAPNGVRYYSKLTEAHFNYQLNTYDISTNWSTTTLSSKQNSSLFNITFSDTSIYITQNQDEDLVIDISVYENNQNMADLYNTMVYEQQTNDVSYLYFESPYLTYVESGNSVNKLYDSSILINLYNGDIEDIEERDNLYTITYNLKGEIPYSKSKVYNHTTYTYNKIIDGYTEIRTLPVVTLNTYSDLKHLELLNDADNGILCNQFQTFTDITISDFTDTDWGTLLQYIKDPTLVLTFNKGFFSNTLYNSQVTLHEENKNTVENGSYKIRWTLIKSNVDIFTATSKELEDPDNIKSPNEQGAYEFTIEEAMSGTYHLRMFIESTNPEPLCVLSQIYVAGLYIRYTNTNDVVKTFELPLVNGCVKNELNVLAKQTPLYTANKLKLAIAPISYIAGYEQSSDKITDVKTTKWFGSDELINIAIKPYEIDDIENNYSVYSTSRETNWNAIKFKPRYFQDNIQSLHILTYNVNNMTNILPEHVFCSSTLAKDQDDLFNTYLQVVYNSALLNPELIEDEYKFLYNNEYYKESRYGLFGNNTATYIQQENDVQVRSQTLLQSMKVWNDLYEHSTHYDSDNPYSGVTETYGNGYQYLPTTIDTGQYSSESIMTLDDIKSVNNETLFDSATYIEEDINTPLKDDEYTPNTLFRSLLYQMKWSYPMYDTSDNLNIIHQLPFTSATMVTDTSTRSDKYMYYNLCYNIYPRMMFNDEEQYNVVLMLRRPSIMRENQYMMDYTDSCLTIDSKTLDELEDPINVMN